jgi:hypothetical protein
VVFLRESLREFFGWCPSVDPGPLAALNRACSGRPAAGRCGSLEEVAPFVREVLANSERTVMTVPGQRCALARHMAA